MSEQNWSQHHTFSTTKVVDLNTKGKTMLTQAQKRHFVEEGYLHIPGAIPKVMIDAVRFQNDRRRSRVAQGTIGEIEK